ncbi:MAG: phosphoribosyltransferase [Bdellovibrionaceae bacterium]|nr:phosphoribosyltransferase [Bdellovibrionales bacterium]MCB9255426.1 phosphoribosyltransferase [Pseudobdellovibrionaceae bacterium]
MFTNREEAGLELAKRLHDYEADPKLVVLGLPRGGVPVAFEVACVLGAPLDVFMVRKIGAPSYPEMAVGAIASGGAMVLHWDILDQLYLSEADLAPVIEAERLELQRRERAYTTQRGHLELEGKTVILVDDGIATGATMEAAVQAVRSFKPAKIVVASPVVSRNAARNLERVADDVVYVIAPSDFGAVGRWYENFEQTSDEEVRASLTKSDCRSLSFKPSSQTRAR